MEELKIVITLSKKKSGTYSISDVQIGDVKQEPSPVRVTKMSGSVEWLLGMTDEESKEIAEMCKTTDGFVREKAKELHNYCLYKGKRYKDYRLFLINAVKKDAPHGSKNLDL